MYLPPKVDKSHASQDGAQRVGRLRGILNKFTSGANTQTVEADDNSEPDMLNVANNLLNHAKSMEAQGREAKILQPLSPEARRDALNVAADIVSESTKLLDGKDEVDREDPKQLKGNLIISSKAIIDKTVFRGADLGIDRYTYTIPNIPNAKTRDVTQELWHFYPDRVEKTIRHTTESLVGDVTPISMTTEKIEADKDELTALLDDIRTSSEFKDNDPL